MKARVTTYVAVDPAAAFAVFTGEVGLWWRPGMRFRPDGAPDAAAPRFEGGAGGRLVFGDGQDAYEVGRVLVWEPGQRLVFEWRTKRFAPGERTEVEVRFEPAEDGGTRVVLEHRGWETLPANSPVLHGLTGGALTAMIGRWWGELVTSLRAHVSARTAPPA